ncbi:hypothetical protein NFC73_13155 [Pseudarthrobacter sp. RMG13]|uniref:Uncharacterized protein n=1 Tax=Pseudarthrobacter humi TaxID=2952523 RepID=A0ABT1LQC4_9MICC|nr:hypothetical protein [Pseudarthrobacter humi]MCP9000669.1 hypothetical protein [Pseudarthrobacter humi]
MVDSNKALLLRRTGRGHPDHHYRRGRRAASDQADEELLEILARALDQNT